MPAALHFEDLYFAYKDSLILENVTFSVEEGDFVGIFGPNGGGKTTLLKLLMGFLTPLKGKILLFGMEPKEARSCIGYVPQFAKMDRQFPITVEEVVQMGLLSKANFWGTLSKSDLKSGLEALEKVGMLEHRNSSFGELSGGQTQRVLIARALASHPKILVLDEPTASIDPEAEAEILKLLSSLKGEMTLLMVTHDLETILKSVNTLLCVHRHVHILSPSEVCEHVGLGLYHKPLLKLPT